MGQFAKEFVDLKSGAFSANTKTIPKEQCKVVTTRSGAIGRNANGEKTKKKGFLEVVSEEDEIWLMEKPMSGKDKELPYETSRQKSVAEGVELKKTKNETVRKEKKVSKPILPEGLPYPHVPTRKEKDRQFAYFLNIF